MVALSVFQYGAAQLAYNVQGDGQHTLLIFHGIGQDRHAFDPLPPALLSAYRIYTIDLFFHGDSRWNSDAPITLADWAAIIQAFCAKEGIASASVFGYSIGARFAFATLKAAPEQISACYLAAPDGIVRSPWFSLATSTKAGRSLFRQAFSHPRLVSKVVNVAERLRLINPFTVRFIHHQVGAEDRRSLIYHSWTAFRRLAMTPAELCKIADRHQLPVRIFLAARDEMIPAAKFITQFKRLHQVELVIVETNHARVPAEALKRILPKE